jgi:HIV Tat-specific factor 1
MAKFNGRIFDGRKVEAYIADGKEKFKKSKKQEEDGEDEAARLESFSNFIEGGEN